MSELLLIDRYFLFREIAAGGMASIYLARLLGSVGFGRTVAIKRLHPQYARDPAFVAMFVDEARIVTCIRHPNVVPVLDVVATPGHLFLVMEYVHGVSLSPLLAAAMERKLPIPPAIVSAIGIGMLEGLHAAHESRGPDGKPLELVHRDVSPQNVLVGLDGVTRVLDFGIAKAKSQLHQTTTGSGPKGKLKYMPPEQLHGLPLDRRSDIWAASVILWELLAGQRLFAADNDGAIVLEIIEKKISPPSGSGGETGEPSPFDEVVMKGLARPLDERFADARTMALALEAACRPASARELGEWVELLAGPALREREEMLRELEIAASAGLPSARSQLAMIADHAARSDEGSAPTPAASRPDMNEATVQAGGRAAGGRASRTPPPPASRSSLAEPSASLLAAEMESALASARDRATDDELPAQKGDDLEPGRTLASTYRIVRRLDRGGMGTVYEALQLTLGRRIAIKVLSDLTPHGAERFAQEALATAALQHPCVVQVSDFRPATNGEPAFLVMELLEGRSLAQLVRDESALDHTRAVGIASQMLSALAAAHRADIVHRDIKPANVFLVDHAGMELVKILDFGIAKLVGDEGGMTTTSMVLGSLPYMAPEQLLGGEVDARVDVYATSVCLFEMLTGRRPFESPTSKLAMLIVDPEPAPDVRTLRPDVPGAFARIVARGLAKRLADRYASADAMRDALITASRELESSNGRSSVVHGSASQSDASAVSVVVAPPRRSRLLLFVALSSVLLVTFGVAVGLTGAKVTERAKPPGPSTAPGDSVATSAASVLSGPVTDAGAVTDAGPVSDAASSVGTRPSASVRPVAAAPASASVTTRPGPTRTGGPAVPLDGVRLDHRK